MSLDQITEGRTRGLAGFVERLSRRLGSGDRVTDGVTRRGVLAGAAVAGSALAVDPKAYALTPQTAYATICGPGNHAWDGWTVFCCTVNNGVNSCPPGSFAAGWWKAARSSWCGGGYQYIVDCNAKCTGCTSGCSGDHICDTSCWNCSCGSGSSATCDQRRHCCNAFRYGQCNTQVSCSGGVNCRVLSCVPPYKWANCTTTSLVDNRTAEHGAPCLEGWGPIAVKYNTLGGNGSWLKASKGPERPVGDNRGKYVAYEGGWIYWTSTTGAHPVDPTVKTAWDSVNGPTGALGYPTGDRVQLTGAWYQSFERGTVCDTTTTPVAVVTEPSQTQWAAGGGYAGAMGWPTGNRVATAGGWVQLFQHGATCDGPTTSPTYVNGTIFARWTAAGRATGVLGFPRARPVTSSAGTSQVFTGGTVADPADGRPAIAILTEINTCWTALGGLAGQLGWPRGEQTVVTGGRGQVFDAGEIWQRTGSPAYAVRDHVLAAWKAAGGVAGRYGLPIGPEQVVRPGTYTQQFTGGTLTVRPTARRTPQV